jgi:hypothetical protein
MATDQLRFSTNWNNKLECDAFTTLRLSWPQNYRVGLQKEVLLKGSRAQNYAYQSKGWAAIIDVKRLKLEQINDYIALLDTGLLAAECQDMIRTMYKYKPINWDTQLLDFILLKYIK